MAARYLGWRARTYGSGSRKDAHVARVNGQTEHGPGGSNPEVAHEHSDVNVRGILVFTASLLVAAIVIHVLIWLLFDLLAEREARANPPPPALIGRRESPMPPEPRLQPSPTQALKDMRAGEDAWLNSYGVVDPLAGVVRLPIGRAIELTAERGLPWQAAPPGGESEQSSANGNTASAPESSGGRPWRRAPSSGEK
jgi:hypothetical protein